MATPPVTPDATPLTPNFYDENGPTPSFAESMRQRAQGPEVAPIAEPEVSPERDDQGRFKAKTSDQPTTQESAPADAPKVEEVTEPVKAETAPESVPGNEAQEHDEEPVKGKEAQKRIRELLARVKELEAAQQPKTDVKPEPSTGTTSDVKAESSTAKPKVEFPDINSWMGTMDEYNTALREWNEHRERELERKIEERIAQADLQRAVEEAERQMPGFKQALNTVQQALVSTPELAPVAQILGDGDGWKEVTHYIGNNTAELQKLAQLSKSNIAQAVIEAVHLRDKVLAKKDSAPVTPQPKVTNVPPPPQPVAARAVVSPFNVNDENIPAEEWNRKRWKQLNEAKRR